MKRKVCFGWTAIACLALNATASAQEYPARVVKLVAPFSAGGSTDVLTRIIGAQLSNRWNQSVVVENRVGASGRIGAEYVAKQSAPDGYTLLVAGAPHAIGMSLFRKLSYNLATDLVAIANIATFPSVIVVHPSMPVKSVKELIALAKARPGEINFGSPNIGSPNHLAMELFKTMAGINMVHIPYKGGSGQMMGDLIGGQVQLASMGFPPAVPQIKNGRLRALAVSSKKRSPALPQVPTVDESGLPGFEVSSWYGIFGPAATPKQIVAKVNADTQAVLASAEMKAKLAPLGAEPAPTTPEAFARFVRAEIDKWAKVVKDSGASAD
ncbi:MAG: tripartite tricarboxylate transporter substrate binding protein [Betaproteobacteria bacterium]|nr:MAG: tripartite tricarboxylate transporter substrate binding protein [Betaproteobacteria bacterium]RPI44786.1 MAG: tripartite tricarboxylate transporter substrate binding protein [Betaproteobacteria bacterium]